MSTDVQEQAILMSLRPLFQEAEEKGLWFFHHSREGGEIWCSPEYLRLQQSKGEYIWPPEHWELRNPRGYMRRLKVQVEELVAEYNKMAERLTESRRLVVEESGNDTA